MIVRNSGDSLLLITQPDHAHLAGTLAAAIRSESALDGPARETILLAAREHDNGWHEVDERPGVNPSDGRPWDFMSGPAAIKHALWPAGIAAVAAVNRRAAALVAEHVLTVYTYRSGEAGWAPFFAAITARRDELLLPLTHADPGVRAAFNMEYRPVQLADALSLVFCMGTTSLDAVLGYRIRRVGSTLAVTPDPFGGATVPLRVRARRIAKRAYANAADLQATLAMAPPEWLTGTARDSLE